MDKLLLLASKRFKSLREDLGLNLDQCAAASGVSRQHIKKFEDGEANITFQKIHDLCNALGVSLSDIVKDEISSPTEEEQLIQQIIMLCNSKNIRDLKCVIALLKAMQS